MAIWLLALGALAVIICMLRFKSKGNNDIILRLKEGPSDLKMYSHESEKGYVDSNIDTKVDKPKKKPKPRLRKPRKNKKTQVKS